MCSNYSPEFGTASDPEDVDEDLEDVEEDLEDEGDDDVDDDDVEVRLNNKKLLFMEKITFSSKNKNLFH